MAKRKIGTERQLKNLKHLIFCEGKTEYWYLSKVLDSRKVKIIPVNTSDSNALKTLNSAKKEFCKPERYEKLSCVFDRDSSSNTRIQLQEANKIIKDSGYNRIFSNPSFEVAFSFAGKLTTRTYQKVKEIADIISKENGIEYAKQQHIIEQLAAKLSFTDICNNSKKCYLSLKINDDNWLDIQDGYSEIFKLKDLAS